MTLMSDRMESNDLIGFTAKDRCDRCGAQARTRATKDGMVLLFCNHHSNRHESKLFSDGWTIEKHMSTQDPLSAASYSE